MTRGKTYKRYTGEFKQEVVETMRRHHLNHHETAMMFDISSGKRVTAWERIYLEEGPEGLYKERRGGKNKKEKPKLKPKEEKDLLAEVEWLRAENAYLKKLDALVRERELRERKHR